MAATLASLAQNAACDAVVDLLDTGTIEFQTAGNAVVGTATLPNPAFGAAAAGAAALSSAVNATVTGAGTVTKALFKRSAGNGGATVFTVTVGTSGADINLSSVVFALNDVIALSSYTHTQPAS